MTHESKYPFKEHSVKLTFNKDDLAEQGITAPYYEDGFGPVSHEVALRYEKGATPESRE